MKRTILLNDVIQQKSLKCPTSKIERQTINTYISYIHKCNTTEFECSFQTFQKNFHREL